MIKKTIQTLALFTALAFAQTSIIPAAYATDSFSNTQQVQKNIEKEKSRKEKEKEKARKEREKEKARRERARLAAAKHSSGLKPDSTPIIKPVAPAPVTPVPVVKPVAPAPVTPVPVVKPVAPAPVAPAPVTPSPVVKPVAPTPVAPAPVAPAPTPTTPAIDGAALYTQYCAGCHGTSKRGKTATSTKNAITNNVGGMGYLSSLSAAQLTAISQY